MISVVAEIYDIHPQTLRLYERERLLVPSRSEGNTRLYTQEDLERLEVILKLTRELGVNLAGVEIILNMRDRMSELEKGVQSFMEFVRDQFTAGQTGTTPAAPNAIVRVAPPRLIRVLSKQRDRLATDDTKPPVSRLLTATRKP
jgi:MerR family transcriptional regulator/heat shock protein HspR